MRTKSSNAKSTKLFIAYSTAKSFNAKSRYAENARLVYIFYQLVYTMHKSINKSHTLEDHFKNRVDSHVIWL